MDVKVMEYEAWNWKQTVQNSNCSVNLDEKLSYTENTYGYNDSITHSSFDDQPQVVTGAHKNIQLPKRLVDCDMVSNSVVAEHSEIVHYVMLVDTELVNVQDALKKQEWKDAMLRN